MLARVVGGQAAHARAIGRPENAVSNWVNGKSLVDPELVVEIERITECPAPACRIRGHEPRPLHGEGSAREE
jgi:DNA-binding transcriptional regulator YdaS (Cro superfamily)